jgi:L-ascorbate 6-phosphate lactonase
MQKVRLKRVSNKQINITWLGQSSFLIKTWEDKIILIDPYLSDYCESKIGDLEVANNNFKRIYPAILKPEDTKSDLILITHEHCDHFDKYSIPILMGGKDTVLAAPDNILDECLNLKIDKKRLITATVGEKIEFENFFILPVFADHGEMAPNAIGFVLDFIDYKLYYTGDTSYNIKKLQNAIKMEPEIIIVPINGKFGNCDAKEASLLVRDCKSKVAIPCHFWTFVEHSGEPLEFIEKIKKNAPECECIIYPVGRVFIYPQSR